MDTSRRCYVLFVMLVASIFLVLLAGNLEDWRTPSDLVPLPLLAVGILGSTISIFVLTLGYVAVAIFGGPMQTVPSFMLGLVALLATCCACMTGIETLSGHERIAHSYPKLIIALAIAYTSLAIWLAVFDRDESVEDVEVDQVETLRRPGASPFRPQETLEM